MLAISPFLHLSLFCLAQLNNLSQTQVDWLIVGVFELWHLCQTLNDIVVHIVERLGSLLSPILAAQRLRVVRLLSMDGRGHETG